MKGKYKIAYAASRGPVVELEEDKRKTFIEYISQFQNISIREKSFGEYIKRISGIETTHVLDPVLLHDKSFYEPIIQRPKRKKGYVLLYVVMESAIPLIELAVDFAKEHDLEVIELSENLADAKIPAGTRHKVVYDIGIEEWDYAKTVYAALRAKKIRCELDDRNEKIGYKIREARQVDRVPYMLILGGQEVENNTVSVRDRATDQTVTCTLDEFIAKISKEIADRV